MRHTLRSSYEAERGRRFARRVVVASIAAFSALAAMVPTKRREAIDRTITARVQVNNDPRIERAMALVSWFGFPPQSRVLPRTYAASSGSRTSGSSDLAALVVVYRRLKPRRVLA